MYVFVVLFASVTIIAGLCMLIGVTAAAVMGRAVEYVSYIPHSVNEAEYGLRTLLFMYPNAVIDTPQNEISLRLKRENTRIITHQETETYIPEP